MGNFSTNSFPSNRWTDSDTLSDLADAIQSVDAAIRHAFGFSVNELTAPFDIDDDGSIVVQTSIAIGTSNAMIDVVDSIPASAGANEELKLAHVTAIRNFLDVQRLPGANIDLNTGQFDNNLSSADDTAQKAFDTLDDIDIDNLFHFDIADEFSGVGLENITATDRIVYEDATDSWAKKYTVVSQLATLVSGYSHTIASHSDTTATGAELEELTDGSETALHIHDDRYYTETELDVSLDAKVDVAGDTMTGDLNIPAGTQLNVDKIRGAPDRVDLEGVEFEGGWMYLVNAYSIRGYMFDGITAKDLLYVSVDDWTMVGTNDLDLRLHGAEARPQYDPGGAGYTDLALFSDLTGLTEYVAVAGDVMTGDLRLANGSYLKGTTDPVPLEINLIGINGNNEVAVGQSDTVLALYSADARPQYNVTSTLALWEDLQYIPDFFNGTFVESFNALVTSDGATVTMSLEQSGGGDLIMRFSDGDTTLDCTTPVQTIALTAGTDDAPTPNYIYVLESTKVLTKSTTQWPSAEHIKVGYFLVPSAAHVQARGCYVNQNWNDHRTGTDGQGHMAHMAEAIRLTMRGAVWHSGVAGAASGSEYLELAASNIDWKSTAGVAYQMHKHTIPAIDMSAGDIAHVTNWGGDAYHEVADLFDIVDDASGNSLNNKYFNLTFWGVCNKTGEHAPLMVNLPTGSYVGAANAIADVDGFDVNTIPSEFVTDSCTGFLICRITVRKSGTAWTIHNTTDLRGSVPSVSAGSGGAGGSISDFSDNLFTIYNVSDVTKIVDWDLSGITTGNTRTISPSDEAMTIPGTADWTDLTDSGVTTLHTHADDGIDTSAFHDDTAGEISALVNVAPASSDKFVFEDNDDSDNKKFATMQQILRMGANSNYVSLEVENNTGSGLSKGDLCYISGDDAGTPEVILADADAEATAGDVMLVVMQDSPATANTGTSIIYGVINGFTGLTIGAAQYVGTTAGDFTETAPSGSGDIVRVAGHAISTTEIFFNPSNTWVEVS